MYWDSCLLFIKHPPTLIHAVSICRNAVCRYFTVTHRVAIKRKSTTSFLTNRELQEPYILKFWGFYLCLIKVCISHSIKFASGRWNLNQQWHKQPHIFVIQAQTSKNYPWFSYHQIWYHTCWDMTVLPLIQPILIISLQSLQYQERTVTFHVGMVCFLTFLVFNLRYHIDPIPHISYVFKGSPSQKTESHILIWRSGKSRCFTSFNSHNSVSGTSRCWTVSLYRLWIGCLGA